MKTKATTNRSAIILLAILAVVMAGLAIQISRSGNKKLNREKLRSEALLSEKLVLEERFAAAQDELAGLEGSNTKLDKKLTELNQLMASKEKEIRKLMADNHTLIELQEKNAELTALCARMESDMADLEEELNALAREKEQLTRLLADMGSRYDYLVIRNTLLEAMLADNFQVEALRGSNDKQTVVARRANTLVSSFDVPAGMGEKLYFKVITPDHREISSKESPYASFRMLNYESDNLLASLSGGGASSGSFDTRAELIYKPEKKLTRGIYKFHVYDGNKYMGSVQLRLR